MDGYLGLVVVAHVPYVRYHGRDPIGEDALHTTIAEALVPLLNTLFDLREQGITRPIGLACSPVLLEQLADPIVQKHFILWIDQWLRQIDIQMNHWRHEGQSHLLYLAQFYLEWGEHIAASFRGRYQRNLVAAIRELCEAGIVEPILLPATNMRLRSIAHESVIRAQIEVAMLNTIRHLGQQPKGIWLNTDETQGLEEILRTAGLRYVLVPATDRKEQPSGWLVGRRLAALFCDTEFSTQVMSFELGYPGDPLYRASLHDTSLSYQRNGINIDEPLHWYDPYYAFQRAQEHAEHFMLLTHDWLKRQTAKTQTPLLVTCCHMGAHVRPWFEQVAWLREILERGHQYNNIGLITPGRYLRQHPPRQMVAPSTPTIQTVNTMPDWLVHRLHAAVMRLESLVNQLPEGDRRQDRLLAQAMRELLLAQDDSISSHGRHFSSSDILRLEQHLTLFHWLSDRVEHRKLNDNELSQLEEIEDRHSVFPMINYWVFKDNEH